MRTPALPSPHERGKHWLQAKVQQLLADSAVALSLRLAGDLEPKALAFCRTMIADCGAGLYFSQYNAILLIRRTLKKMGIVSA